MYDSDASDRKPDINIDDDYYAFLNVSKTATDEEIRNAYKMLSKFYHPDKHFDAERKREAEIMFNKAKKAYDVLMDGHRRAIYDTLGTKGLETDGWALVEKTKTPQEIREEYERLIEEREERRLQQRTNPKGTITVGINGTDLFDHYRDDYEWDGFYVPSFDITMMSLSQSIEAPLTAYDTLTLSGNLSSSNGTGSGTIATALRHVISAKTWTEVELSAGQGPLLTLKGFRTISKTFHANAHALFHFSPIGVRPGINVVLSRHLDKHLIGYLTWKAGIQSAMNTLLAWDSQRARIIGSIQLGIPHSFVSISYLHKLETNDSKLKVALKAGTFGAIVEYGCETRLSQHSNIGASISVGVPSGVTLRLRLNRANQSYIFPILLSDEIIPNAIFYGTLAPLLGYYCLKVFIINPYNQREEERDKQKLKQANAAKMAEKRKEAESVVSLMREAFARIVHRETEKNGLIIIKAIYGSESVISEFADKDDQLLPNLEAIEVTIPLQCLMSVDSTLAISSTSKSQLPGFYDPCLGEEKKLFIKYNYNNKLHEILISDLESVVLPSEEHLIVD